MLVISEVQYPEVTKTNLVSFSTDDLWNVIYYFISATSANITEEAKKIYKSRNFQLKVEPSKGKYR